MSLFIHWFLSLCVFVKQTPIHHIQFHLSPSPSIHPSIYPFLSNPTALRPDSPHHTSSDCAPTPPSPTPARYYPPPPTPASTPSTPHLLSALPRSGSTPRHSPSKCVPHEWTIVPPVRPPPPPPSAPLRSHCTPLSPPTRSKSHTITRRSCPVVASTLPHVGFHAPANTAPVCPSNSCTGNPKFRSSHSFTDPSEPAVMNNRGKWGL